MGPTWTTLYGMELRIHAIALLLAGCAGSAGLEDSSTPPPTPDQPPQIVDIRVEPAVATWDLDDLVCLFDLEDPDGDPVDAQVSWTVDDAPWPTPSTTTWPGDTIPGHALSAGEEWRCSVTATGSQLAFATAEARAAPVGGNILLLVADDLGTDKLAAYGEHPVPSPTPVIDELAATSVLFRSAYASPSCSPTRAALLTGRYGSRLGIGTIVDADSSQALAPEEIGLPQVLASAGYTSALAGKWHLAGLYADDFTTHPAQYGFAQHAGSMHNLRTALGGEPDDAGYFFWQKNTDGALAYTSTYATTDTVDDAIRYVETLPEPWLVQVSFNAPHIPLHWPPPELHDQPVTTGGGDLQLRQYDAMVQAMDTELGRLLDALGERREQTTIIFLGDNGTPGQSIRPPWDPDRGKGTLYEGGVRVPLLVSGPAVRTPGSSSALVHVVDLFPTLARLAGLPALETPDGRQPSLDGRSILPALRTPSEPTQLRDVVLAELFKPNDTDSPLEESRTLRDSRYKLIRERYSGEGELAVERLFELGIVPWSEGEDLLTPSASPSPEVLEAYERLAARLDALEEELGVAR